ncbi:hypothetical protein K505DRAFT_253405 [Melanomma pulvis-pyrius CBS 109.77]|uniref:Protein kinase domain-containing protein n=1 Tax=Melanomma pulvis-pyrius CBS 109.77 TaxID=1314802 RepID=A0A6A6WYW5_9PLEO|nr:hypothetical protein K505DRAFT_253405 [Melanomma pulvis-pyrius CBS 109.77]
MDGKESWLAADAFYPQYEPHMTKFEGEESAGVYIKQQMILEEDIFLNDPMYYKLVTLREVEVCEVLALHPHPNICQYLGVVCDSRNRIVGVAYERYDRDLKQLMNSRERVKVNHILKAVHDGLTHMHTLGLVHCDAYARNIFVKGNKVVVGDFDSTHRIGQIIGQKGGGFSEGRTKAGIQMDNAACSLLKSRLQQYERQY